MIVKKGEQEEFYLFDNVRFGDRFHTRSGDLAIFIYYTEAGYRLEIDMWTFITERYMSGYHCGEHGRVVDYNSRFLVHILKDMMISIWILLLNGMNNDELDDEYYTVCPDCKTKIMKIEELKHYISILNDIIEKLSIKC